MKRDEVFRCLWTGVVVALLHGCGGDEGASDTTSFNCAEPPEGQAAMLPDGIFGGSIEGREDPSFVLVSRPNEEMGTVALLLYGPDLASTSRISGLMLIDRSGGSCNVSDLRYRNASDYRGGFETGTRLEAYANLAVNPAQSSLSGTLRYLDNAGASYRVSGTGLPGSNFSMTAVPQLADVVGEWQLNAIRGGEMTLSVDSGGVVRGSYGGCPVSGTITPGSEGLNLFGTRLNFEPSPSCVPRVQNSPIAGWALLMPLTGGGAQLLLWSPSLESSVPEIGYLLAIGRR